MVTLCRKVERALFCKTTGSTRADSALPFSHSPFWTLSSQGDQLVPPPKSAGPPKRSSSLASMPRNDLGALRRNMGVQSPLENSVLASVGGITFPFVVTAIIWRDRSANRPEDDLTNVRTAFHQQVHLGGQGEREVVWVAGRINPLSISGETSCAAPGEWNTSVVRLVYVQTATMDF